MLPWPYRLYFWSVHGMFGEVVFTGLWEFVVTGNWTLIGFSSLWSFLTYGLGTFFGLEYLHGYLTSQRVPLLFRCVIYVLMAYVWEFSFGFILSHFNACPWDYTDFDYDFMGLITLEYAPMWFLGGLYFELIMSMMTSLEQIPEWKRRASVHE